MWRSARAFGRRWLLLALAMAVQFAASSQPMQTARADNERTLFFAETGYSVSGVFLSYWESHGGLFSFGYPLTEPLAEDGLVVQYFERARFERHPENAGTDYEVLLGQLGRQLTWDRDFAPAQPDGDAAYFPETHHTLRGAFLDCWNKQGGLARFGFPISEETSETNARDGRSHNVQYFERARFEFHPENTEPYQVLLGHLGREMLALRQKASRYVQVMNRQLVFGPGLRPLKLKGFNYFPRDFAWTEFEQWPMDRVDFELGKARELGANTLRVFIREDAFGGPQADWSRQEGFRKFVALARSRGFYLVVGLFDGLRKSPDPGWDAWPSAGTPEEAQDKAFLSAVVGAWKDEPAILAWDVYNEPDYVSETEYQWDAHRANRLDWLARMAAETRRLDPNHLITIGVALAGSNMQPAGGLTVTGLVDFVSIHYYLRNYRDKSLETVLRELRAQTRKPLLVEEAGQPTITGFGDDAEQARFISDTMRAVTATNTSGALVWTLYDWPRHADNSEGHYGLLRPDDTAKPAADAFRFGF